MKIKKILKLKSNEKKSVLSAFKINEDAKKLSFAESPINLPRIFHFDFCQMDDHTFSDTQNPGDSIRQEFLLSYQKIKSSVTESMIEMKSTCIIFIGCAKSGKTESIYGIAKEGGVLEMLVNDIFAENLSNQKVDQNSNTKGLSIQNDPNNVSTIFSIIELFGNKIFDLLSSHANPEISVTDVETQLKAFNFNDFQRFLRFALKNKSLVANMHQNLQTTTIYQFDISGKNYQHNLKLVDLTFPDFQDFQSDDFETDYNKMNSFFAFKDLFCREKQFKVVSNNTQQETKSFETAANLLISAIPLAESKIVSGQNLMESKLIHSSNENVLQRILIQLGNEKCHFLVNFFLNPVKEQFQTNLELLKFSEIVSLENLRGNLQNNEFYGQNDRKSLQNLELLKENLKGKSRDEMMKQIHRSYLLEKSRFSFDLQKNIEVVEKRIERKSVNTLTNDLRNKILEQEHNFQSNLPFVSNLDQDPFLNERLVIHVTKKNPVIFTKLPSNLIKMNAFDPLEDMSVFENRIYLNNVYVLKNHGRIFTENGNFYFSCDDKFAAMNAFVNGEDLSQNFNPHTSNFIRVLRHLDRIMIGTFNSFLFQNPEEEKAVMEIEKEEIDWEFCQMERFQKQEKFDQLKIDAIFKNNIDELRQKKENLKKEYENDIFFFQKKYDLIEEEKDKEVQSIELKTGLAISKDELMRVQLEFSKRIKVLMIEQHKNEKKFEQYNKILEKEAEINNVYNVLNMNLENKFLLIYGKIKEANKIAKVLQRNILFSGYISSLDVLNIVESQENLLDQFILKVKVTNYEKGWVNFWSCDKFEKRLILFRETLDEYEKHRGISFRADHDPFFEAKEFRLEASGFLMAKNVLYRFSLNPKVGILGNEGEFGYLTCKIVPTDTNNEEINEGLPENNIKRPVELIQKKICLNFKLVIEKVTVYDSKSIMRKDVYLEIIFRDQNQMTKAKSPVFQFKDCQHDLNWTYFVVIPEANEELIEHYIQNKIKINLFVDDNSIPQEKSRLNSTQIQQKTANVEYELNGNHSKIDESKRCNLF